MSAENPFHDPIIREGVLRSLEEGDKPLKTALDVATARADKLDPSAKKDYLPTALEVAMKRANALVSAEEGNAAPEAIAGEDKAVLDSLAKEIKVDAVGSLPDAETQLVLDEMKAKEEREKMEKMMNGENNLSIVDGETKTILEDIKSREDKNNLENIMSAGEAGLGARTKIDRLVDDEPEGPSLENPTDLVPPIGTSSSPEASKPEVHPEDGGNWEANLSEARRAYARKTQEREAFMEDKKQNPAAKMRYAQEELALKSQYIETLHGYREKLLTEAGENPSQEKLSEILLKTSLAEADKFYDEQIAVRLEEKGGESKWTQAGKIIERIGEAYRKRPLKEKVLLAVAFGTTGLAAGAIGGATAGAIMSGLLVGRVAQRWLGGAAAAVGLAAGLEKHQKRKAEKGLEKEFGKELLASLTVKQEEVDRRIFELAGGKDKEKYTRFIAAGGLGLFIGSGAMAETIKLGLHGLEKYFGFSISGTLKNAGLYLKSHLANPFTGSGTAQAEIARNVPGAAGIKAPSQYGDITSPDSSVNRAAQRALDAAREEQGRGGGVGAPPDVTAAHSGETGGGTLGEAVKTPNMGAGAHETLAGAATEKTASGEYVVRAGDNLWRVTRDKINEGGDFKGLTGSPEDIAAKKANVIGNILKGMETDPKSFGVASGDLDKIYPGDNIKLPGALTNQEMMDKLIEKANKLTPEQIHHISEEIARIAKSKNVSVTEIGKVFASPEKPPGMTWDEWQNRLEEQRLSATLNSPPQDYLERVREFRNIHPEYDGVPDSDLPMGEPRMEAPVIGPNIGPKNIIEVNLAEAAQRENYNIGVLGLKGINYHISYPDLGRVSLKKFFEALPLSKEQTLANFGMGKPVKIPGHLDKVMSNIDLEHYLNLRDFLKSSEAFGKGFTPDQLDKTTISDALKKVPKEVIDKWTAGHK